MNTDNNSAKYMLLVDSHNQARTFGVARNKDTVEYDKLILELPPKEIILKEIDNVEDNMLLFPFGSYIVVYMLEKEILFFIHYTLEVDKPILELLLQCKVTNTFLEHFFSIQFKLQTEFKWEEDLAILQRN